MRRIQELASKIWQTLPAVPTCRPPSAENSRNRRAAKLPLRHAVIGLMTSLLLGGSGCQPTIGPTLTKETSTSTKSPSKLIAQGQIMPWGGLIRLNGTPGDSIDSILVAVGDTITAGQPLIEFHSASLRQSQLDSLKQQLADAELQKSAAIERAQLELNAARLQLDQALEQRQAVDRRAESLSLLKQQAEEAQAALRRIESVAADPLTRSMISQIEIDKQRASVTASQVQYIQQRELQLQSESAAEWGEKLAKERVTGAESALRLAQQSDPLSLIRTQIVAAEQQLERARLTSPIAGNVVSIDTRVGESVAQFPLIQVADLSRMACIVEIYQTDAPHVRVGQNVQLRNVAFDQPLKGHIARIDRLVGYPQLRSMDPLAKVDYRTLPVMVEIAAEDSVAAARWLQLQVEVEVALSETSSTAPPQSNTTQMATPPSRVAGPAASPIVNPTSMHSASQLPHRGA